MDRLIHNHQLVLARIPDPVRSSLKNPATGAKMGHLPI